MLLHVDDFGLVDDVAEVDDDDHDEVDVEHDDVNDVMMMMQSQSEDLQQMVEVIRRKA